MPPGGLTGSLIIGAVIKYPGKRCAVYGNGVCWFVVEQILVRIKEPVKERLAVEKDNEIRLVIPVDIEIFE